MPSLVIRKFSCIEHAILDLRPVTMLIGRQSSGKSVIAKLFYFFSNIPQLAVASAEEGLTLRLFKKKISTEFAEWFPAPAWGTREFQLSYIAGPLTIDISRKPTQKRPSLDVVIEISGFLSKNYERILKEFRESNRQKRGEDDFGLTFSEGNWRTRVNWHQYLSKSLGNNYVSSQVFVPAGRSFYTNLQKTVTIFEHGSQIDAVTKRFGRLFISVLDGQTYFGIDKPNNRTKEFFARQKAEFSRIMGGEMKLGQNDRHLAAADGRKIPLSLLSSGQQELLPLLLVTKYFAHMIAGDRDPNINLLYIEEPEAHLFPSTQGAVTSYLAGLSNFTAPTGAMIITTHSPYVLAKLNTLIKAHSIAITNESLAARVANIVPRHQWLAPANVAAYALSDNGRLKSISTDNGLIDSDYLDSFSDTLNDDFMALLELENR